MYEDTPNKEEIDWIAERIREIYDYDRLKDCDIDYLYNQEYGMEVDKMFFEAIFPDEDGLQGDWRAYVMGEENADREALTEAERIRLRMLKKEAEIEIRRAFGHRKELRRDHRSKFANSVADALSSVADAISSLVSLLPWK
jgi:hypothetical protein